MSGTIFRRKIVLLLLVAVLAAAATGAAEPLRAASVRGGSQATPDLAVRFWHWLTGVWVEAGCILDPNGRCIPGPGEGSTSTHQGDEGCIIDPNGRCGS